MSTRTAPSSATPKSAARRATWAVWALATSVLVGMQPVLTQVPPNRFRSTTATREPEHFADIIVEAIKQGARWRQIAALPRLFPALALPVAAGSGSGLEQE